MLVPSRFDHNRRSVLHTSNDCCKRGLPTFADPVAKDRTRLRRFQTFPPLPRNGEVRSEAVIESASRRLVSLSIIVTVQPHSLVLRLLYAAMASNLADSVQ